MATIQNQADGGTIGAASITHPSQSTIGAVNPTVRTSPETYAALGDLVGLYAKPDNRDLLIKTYGDQGITGFLKLTGAVNAAATQDEVTYWEEGRRHDLIEGSLAATSADFDSIDLASVSDWPFDWSEFANFSAMFSKLIILRLRTSDKTSTAKSKNSLSGV